MQRYSRIAILLHWLIAAAIAFQISLGWGMSSLGSRGFAMFQLHKSVGITILLLTLIRIAVRFWKPRPTALEGGFNGLLAKSVHLGLYVFMLGAPLTGWAMVSGSTRNIPTLLFGTVPLPRLPVPRGTHELFEGAHSAVVWLGMALFLLHVAGALRHHVLLRDGLIYRMTPRRSLGLMLGLIGLIPVGLVLGKAVLPTARPAATEPADTADNATENTTEPAANATVAAPPAENTAEVPVNAAQVTETPVGPPPFWTVQPGGKLGFAVVNGTDTIKGGFSRWTAKIAMDPNHPETADIAVDIDLASGSVGDPTQDAMLAGDDFFAIPAHPAATFHAEGAARTGPDSYRASGTLTLKGVSKPQTIKFTLSGTGLRRAVKGTASISRESFSIGKGDSGADLAPMVSLSFQFDATGKLP